MYEVPLWRRPETALDCIKEERYAEQWRKCAASASFEARANAVNPPPPPLLSCGLSLSLSLSPSRDPSRSTSGSKLRAAFGRDLWIRGYLAHEKTPHPRTLQ